MISSLTVITTTVALVFPVHHAFTTHVGLQRRPSSLSLHVLPPMIISPLIKKMREENAKKNLPMVDMEEAQKEAPGLKVGKEVWKWPAVWPYDEITFKPVATLESPTSADNLNQIASAISGVATVTPFSR